VHPPPSPARANFTLMTECTPESSGCNSVYSVVLICIISSVAYFVCGRLRVRSQIEQVRRSTFYILHITGGILLDCPLDFTVSEDAGVEPRTVATSPLAVRRSNQ
jgi:hypothetical protein